MFVQLRSKTLSPCQHMRQISRASCTWQIVIQVVAAICVKKYPRSQRQYVFTVLYWCQTLVYVILSPLVCMRRWWFKEHGITVQWRVRDTSRWLCGALSADCCPSIKRHVLSLLLAHLTCINWNGYQCVRGFVVSRQKRPLSLETCHHTHPLYSKQVRVVVTCTWAA